MDGKNVILKIHYTWTYVFLPDGHYHNQAYHIVRDACSFWEKGFEFKPSYIKGDTDGRSCLYNEWSNKFPTGLIYLVSDWLKSKGFNLIIDDQRVYPDISGCTADCLTGFDWRDCQRDAIDVILKHKNGVPLYPNGVFELPPGSGKTLLMLGVLLSLKQFPCLWLTHTDTLLTQTYERFEPHLKERGISLGTLNGSNKDMESDVVIGMVQSLRDRKKYTSFFERVKLLICDEVHRGSASDYHKTLLAIEAPFRYGCSATPFLRTDRADMRLRGSIGDLLYRLTPEQGVQAGFFIKPDVYFVDYMDDGYKNIDAVVKMYGGYHAIYSEGIVENERRNQAILELSKKCIAQNRKTLILIRILKHGLMLKEKINDYYGHKFAVFLSGKNSEDQRKKAVADMRSGKIKIIISSTIFDEGFDFQELDAGILASGGEADIKTIQRIGRLMRACDDKQHPVVYDFIDRFHPTLLKHSISRWNTSLSVANVGRASIDELPEAIGDVS